MTQLPPFGDERITYETTLTEAAETEIFPKTVGGEQVKTQLMFLDGMPVFGLKSGDDPLSERDLYDAYLQSIAEFEQKTERMLAEAQHRAEVDQRWEESQPKDPREMMP